MDKNTWLSAAVLIAVIVLGVVAFIFRKKDRRAPDYKSFFYIGILWMAVGLVSLRENYLFFIMGVAFAVIGLSRKKDWVKNHRKWSELDTREKRIKYIVAISLGFLVAALFVILLHKK